MKKIITAIAFIALTTVSAKAIDFGGFSVTAGLGQNLSVWGARGVEQEFSESGTLPETNREHGVFADEYASYFAEIGIGQYVSLGYNMASDPIKTPSNVTNEGATTQQATVQVDFNDLETQYIKINIPGGMFVKYGTVAVDIKVNEVIASGSTYADRSTEGTSLGLGYQGHIGESGLGFRMETNYIELDNVTTDNGTTIAGSNSTNGGRNQIDIQNMEGVTAMFAITYTLGRK